MCLGMAAMSDTVCELCGVLQGDCVPGNCTDLEGRHQMSDSRAGPDTEGDRDNRSTATGSYQLCQSDSGPLIVSSKSSSTAHMVMITAWHTLQVQVHSQTSPGLSTGPSRAEPLL